MYYYGSGYPGTPTGGYYPGAPVYQPYNNKTSLWAIVLVIFILFVIIGCGLGFRGGCGFGC